MAGGQQRRREPWRHRLRCIDIANFDFDALPRSADDISVVFDQIDALVNDRGHLDLPQSLTNQFATESLSRAITSHGSGIQIARALTANDQGRHVAGILIATPQALPITESLIESPTQIALVNELADFGFGLDPIFAEALLNSSTGNTLATGSIDGTLQNRFRRSMANPTVPSTRGNPIAVVAANSSAAMAFLSELFSSDEGIGFLKLLANLPLARAFAMNLVSNGHGLDLAASLAVTPVGQFIASSLRETLRGRELAGDLAENSTGNQLGAQLGTKLGDGRVGDHWMGQAEALAALQLLGLPVLFASVTLLTLTSVGVHGAKPIAQVAADSLTHLDGWSGLLRLVVS